MGGILSIMGEKAEKGEIYSVHVWVDSVAFSVSKLASSVT